MLFFIKKKKPEFHGLVSVDISFSGDMIGSSSSLLLERDGNRCFVVSRQKKAFNKKEKVTKKKVDESFFESAQAIINDYNLPALSKLPESKIQELDGGSRQLLIRFEPFETYRISATQELTEEALEMWNRLEKLLKSA